MNTEPSVTNVDESKLVTLIEAAKRRVVFLAPGVSVAVARALEKAWDRLKGATVRVIVDVDPEGCRLGYGTIEGLKILQQAAAKVQTAVCCQPGVRIGLIIADDSTFIFTPTPLLIEAGSRQPDHPNAIRLQALPYEVVKDMGLGENPEKERIIGRDAIHSTDIESMAADLANNPPVKFDLARRVRVFTSRFQFVEFEMTGCYISRKKVPIPSSLVGLAKERDVQSQFHAHFNLVNTAKLEVKAGNKMISEEILRRRKQEITKNFLISLKSYGSVVLRANKEKFMEAVNGLEADIKTFQEGISEDLHTYMDKNAKALVRALLPAVKQNPPDAYTKVHGPSISEGQIRQLLETDIKKAFGQTSDLIEEMKVSLVFKDLAYESLVDKEFLEIAREAMPNVEFLHEEYDAVKAVQ